MMKDKGLRSIPETVEFIEYRIDKIKKTLENIEFHQWDGYGKECRQLYKEMKILNRVLKKIRRLYKNGVV